MEAWQASKLAHGWTARTIFEAANDESWRLRYTADSDARLLSLVRKFAPDQLFFSILRGRAF
jgi:hypothetical protein